MSAGLTGEQRDLQEAARRFARERIAPGYMQREKAGGVDRDLIREMGALGLIGADLPEEHGGLGAASVTAGIAIEALAHADINVSYVPLLASLNGQILSQHGQPEVTGPWLRKLIAGEALVAIALTEPRGGSDAANLRLRVERTADGYVINGEKTSISAADQADAIVVFGRTGTVDSGAHGVTALLVPAGTPGLTRSRFDCHGQRAIGRGQLSAVRAEVFGTTPYITTGALQTAGVIKLLDGEVARVGFASGSKAFGHRYLLGFCEERGLARATVSKL